MIRQLRQKQTRELNMFDKVAKTGPHDHVAAKKAAASMDVGLEMPARNSTPVIFRSASCACGGGCPRCQSKSENLSVSQPNDAAEIEADQMAAKVVQRLSLSSAPTPPPRLTAFDSFAQRKFTYCEENQIQRKADGDSPHHMHNIESRLVATKGRGAPMPNHTKTQMESAFGADFSGVRVHTGSDAVQLSQDLNAHAFTHGSDVYFNEGKYSPYSTEGTRLLAHELAHTVRQNTQRSLFKNKKQPEDVVCAGKRMDIKDL